MVVRSILISFSIFVCVSSFVSDDLRVTLPNGSKLIGRYLRSFSGRPIKSFLGIPFAKPPVGRLRFKAPEPIEKWNHEYKAIEDGPMCPQRRFLTTDYDDVGSEDCLYLNIYVPHSFEVKQTNLPVLMNIHGGRFEYMSGTRLEYGPDYFLDHDVILVSANYRIGPLGFLSTEVDTCPGNFGLKDQVIALMWIRENIQQFGGNPNSITIFGASSGAGSVTYLMASPLANGLFSKAIAQSGTNLAPHMQPAPKGVARKNAEQLAEHFNCYVPNNWTQTIDCLRDVPAMNIALARFDLYNQEVRVAYTPVVEPESPGAFITMFSPDSIPEQSLKIPFLSGVTSDEGLIKSGRFLCNVSLLDAFIKNFKNVMPIMFYYDHLSSSVQTTITSKIKAFYFNNHLTRDKMENITNLFGDGWYLFPANEYLRLRLAYKEHAATYLYLFSHEGTTSVTGLPTRGTSAYHGVCHGDDHYYMFPLRERSFPFTLPTKEDEQVRMAMSQMWVDFARTGNPTPDSSYLPKWNKAESFPINYFRIGNFRIEDEPFFGMANGTIFDRTQFWKEISTHLLGDVLEKEEL